MNYKLIDNVVISNIDFKDMPDFVDAFIDSDDYDGVPMDEEQLNEINNNITFVYECITKQLY